MTFAQNSLDFEFLRQESGFIYHQHLLQSMQNSDQLIDEFYYKNDHSSSMTTDSGINEESRLTSFEQSRSASYHTSGTHQNSLRTEESGCYDGCSFSNGNLKYNTDFTRESSSLEDGGSSCNDVSHQLELRISTPNELAHYNEIYSTNEFSYNNQYHREKRNFEGNYMEKSLKQIQRKEHQRLQDKNRTRALNQAFSRLRSCLPEIPRDTKLTKIRTLKYAISYIRELISLTDSSSDSSSIHHSLLNENLLNNSYNDYCDLVIDEDQDDLETEHSNPSISSYNISHL